MQKWSGTHAEQDNEPTTSFHHLDVTLVMSFSEEFCEYKEGLR